MAKRRDRQGERIVAAGRIELLLARAQRVAQGPDADLADRYAALAREVALKHQTGLGRAGGQVCRGCSSFLVSGRNARTRMRVGNIVTTCLRCGHIRRRGLAPRVGGSA